MQNQKTEFHNKRKKKVKKGREGFFKSTNKKSEIDASERLWEKKR